MFEFLLLASETLLANSTRSTTFWTGLLSPFWTYSLALCSTILILFFSSISSLLSSPSSLVENFYPSFDVFLPLRLLLRNWIVFSVIMSSKIDDLRLYHQIINVIYLHRLKHFCLRSVLNDLLLILIHNNKDLLFVSKKFD